MDLVKVTLDELVNTIERIPSEWMNSVGKEVLDTIPIVVERLRKDGLSKPTIEALLRQTQYALDVFRLILGLSQDEMVNDLIHYSKIHGLSRSFTTIRDNASHQASRIAETLIDNLGLTRVATDELYRDWKYQDVLLERYKYQRGRAIKGQKRGRSLEDDVESLLKQWGTKYIKGRTFKSRKGAMGKADFSIPSHISPKVVIEVKGYEATGSKLTDVLGDISKIVQAKDPETRFYLVTDGIGWMRRLSDLEHIVKLHDKGEIDMIFTRKTLTSLQKELSEI